MSPKKIVSDIRKKTAGMSRSEKLDYLWEYYRLEFFVTAFLLIVFISISCSVINNKLEDPVLKVGMINDVNLKYGNEIDALLAETFPDATGHQAPNLIVFSSPANESNMYGAVQLAAYLSADELDCAICDDSTLEYFLDTDRSVGAVDLIETELGKILKDYGYTSLYYVWFKDSERADAAVAFSEALLK